MSDFTENGAYLSPGFNRWVDLNRKRHAGYFALAEDVNKTAFALLAEIRAKSHNQPTKGSQHNLVLATMLRGFEHFQGIVILAEKGMVAQMAVLTRALLESEF